MKPASPSNSKKTVRELVILVLVIGVLGFLMLHRKSGSNPTVTQTAVTAIPAPIQTTFNQSAISQLSGRDTNYPSVDPQPGDLGKTDPFQ